MPATAGIPDRPPPQQSRLRNMRAAMEQGTPQDDQENIDADLQVQLSINTVSTHTSCVNSLKPSLPDSSTFDIRPYMFSWNFWDSGPALDVHASGAVQVSQQEDENGRSSDWAAVAAKLGSFLEAHVPAALASSQLDVPVQAMKGRAISPLHHNSMTSIVISHD